MSHSAERVLEHAMHTAHQWVNEVCEQAGLRDRHASFQGIRGVLHALRDRLPVEQAVELGGQLPLLIRGLYYEAWRPHGKPFRERKKEEFLAHVQETLADPTVDIEALTRAVLRVLANHVSPGEVKHVQLSLPKEVQSLWTDARQTLWF